MSDYRLKLAVPLLALFILVLGGLACGPASPTVQPTPTVFVPPPSPPPATIPPTQPPPPPPTVPPTQPPVCATVSYGGVTLCYDPALASAVTGETVPAENIADAPWGATPEHVRFSFVGYPLSATFHEPHIYIYPIADFQAINPGVTQTIAALQQLLAQRPTIPSGSIPFLPIFNAAQLMRAQTGYLDFQNGSGVRFLTQYDQASIPINSNEMFYTFQGLTTDGAYYVAAVLPTAHPTLPADGSNPPGGDWEAFANNWDSYILALVAQLDAAPAATFTPDLSLLDGMMESLLVQ